MFSRSTYHLLALLGLSGACAPPACSDAEDRTLRNEVEILVRDDGPLSRQAHEALVARGERAIAILETGLYQAGPPGRRRVVNTLAAIRSPLTAPILAHLARWDTDPDVRQAAERALTGLAPSPPP